MLLVMLFNNLIFPTRAMALTSGPSQPEFSSFNSASASDMVNLFTGDFSYNIPLMDVDGYPVNISYRSSPGMEQEASWVGLGWNINSGAVNRSVRGLPDDFNGEEIKREIHTEDLKSWGVGIGYGTEIAGYYGASKGMGVTKSNYSGVGIEFYFEPTLALAAGNKLQGGLTAGLGLKAGTTDGVNIYAQAGLSGQYNKSKTSGQIGINMGGSYNSRDGLRSKNAGVGISGSHNKKVGIGVRSSSSIPASSQGFLPQMTNSTESESYSLDFKLGVNECIASPFGSVKGYYTKSGLSRTDLSLRGYGYLNSQNGDENALHDFSREKDGMMYAETPNMPLTNYSYDMFSASAQGMEMAFRPYRNDIGMVYDNVATESSFGLGVSGELMAFSTDVNIGVNTNTHWSDGRSGKWEVDNDMQSRAAFTDASGSYEAAYFKVAGEKTADDNVFLGSIMDNKPVSVKLEKNPDETWKASNKLIDNAGNIQSLGLSTAKTKRAVRNSLVSTLTADEATEAGVEKTITSYAALYPSAFSNMQNLGNVVNLSNSGMPYGELLGGSSIARLAHANYKKDHISELMVTTATGGRYVYGIPVYNRLQREATFNISGSVYTHASAVSGLINYSSTDASKNNTKGLDHFYERNTVPDYVHSYLLTEQLSSDYVDRTNDGPTQDDYGDYTKFNYTRIGGNGAYQWRMPYLENKAAFNQGFLSDKNDDKASYVFGTRDLWVPHSIETKNYIAFFVLDNTARLDGIGAASEDGAPAGGAGGTKQNRLKEIRLYAKKSLIDGLQNGATPIKVVHFEYDYSLCPGVPNNSNTAASGVAVTAPGGTVPGNGKLTLKKIYFTYGNTAKGGLTPYTFTYCNGNYNNASYNPVYDPSAVDRWGYYQPNPTGINNSIDFPYTTQDGAAADVNAMAWNLTEIKTPAGSKVKVTYEADDYAYVQNKEAGQMFKIKGIATSLGSNQEQGLYDNDFLVVDLSASGADGVPTSAPNALADMKEKYFKGLAKVYIKACVQLVPGKYEFIPLYADIDDVFINASSGYTYTYGGASYYNAVIRLKREGLNDDGTGLKINPIVKASFQLGRTYLPGIVFPGSQTTGNNSETIIKGMVTLVQDMTSLFSGINKALYNRKVARNFDPDRSVARLYHPAGTKKGGGSRVKQIEVDDNWAAMTGEATSTYGQVYSYTTVSNGKEISSGVASYEPLNGGDDNSNRRPVEFTIRRSMAPNDEYFQEEPLGESFFPDALVGYSKVTVKNLDRSAQNVVRHATGKTEYGFYTAKDFPVFADRTRLQKQPVKPDLIKSLLNFGSTDKLYMSQGYCIRTNDMHGKPRSVMHYAETDPAVPYAGATYYYRTNPGTTNQLNNTVSVINPANVVSNKQIGQTTDIVTDARMAEHDMWGAGAAVNVNLSACFLYVPLVFVWPSFSHERREFHSIGTTKVIHQYGLVDSTVAFNNHSIVKTKNLLYDEENGEVVLTSTNNNFDQPVYDLNYPAYWAYQRMGHAYKNTGITIKANLIGYNNTNGSISTNLLVRGDEVLIKDNVLNSSIKAWVVFDETNTTHYLVNQAGNKITTTTAASSLDVKVIRSGYRNMQALPMGSLSSLAHPVVSNKIDVSATTKVLGSSAVEYDENWHLVLGASKTFTCECTIDQAFVNAEITFINALLNDPANASTLEDVSNNGNSSSPFQVIYTNTLSYGAAFLGHFVSPYGIYAGGYESVFVTKSQGMESYGPMDYLHISFNTPFNVQPNINVPLCPGGAGSNYSILLKAIGGGGVNIWTKVKNIALEKVASCCGIINQSRTLSPFELEPACHCIKLKCSGPDITSFNAVDDITGFKGCRSRLSCNYAVSVTNKCGKLQGAIVNPYVENIRGNWRPKTDYSYLVNRDNTADIKVDGNYSSFKPFYNQTSSLPWLPVHSSSRADYNALNPFDNWQAGSTAKLVSQNGNVLQVNNRVDSIASLYGYNHTLVVGQASHAYYNEVAFDGFEDYDYLYKECSNFSSLSTSSGYIGHFNFYPDWHRVTSLAAHTGRYSLRVPNGSPGKVSISRKLTNPNPAGTSDNVPYTLKARDNAGLFGPFFQAASKKYVLSVWVRPVQGTYFQTSPIASNYPAASVSVNFFSGASPVPSTMPSLKRSPVINGWQKLEYVFDVPGGLSSTASIEIELRNTDANRPCLFDDLRIHPFNSNMKTMVYDPHSLRLMAEHDDRNYATIYEYDDEGTLVRVKKETEKGIYTLKETRSGLRK